MHLLMNRHFHSPLGHQESRPHIVLAACQMDLPRECDESIARSVVIDYARHENERVAQREQDSALVILLRPQEPKTTAVRGDAKNRTLPPGGDRVRHVAHNLPDALLEPATVRGYAALRNAGLKLCDHVEIPPVGRWTVDGGIWIPGQLDNRRGHLRPVSMHRATVSGCLDDCFETSMKGRTRPALRLTVNRQNDLAVILIPIVDAYRTTEVLPATLTFVHELS